ncbi:MAG: hypothetical protein ABEH66_04790 [Halobacteriales archaeon]
MVDFLSRLGAARDVAARHLALALVPFVSAFLDITNIVRVVSFRGGHAGITFRFPAAVVDYWTFASVPNQGGGVQATGTLLFVPVVIVVQAGLAAGYLGSIAEATESGRYDFVANVKRYAVPFLGYVAIAFLLGSGAVVLGLLGGPGGAALLVLVLVPLFLIFGYLFYATPYLIVLRDAGLVAALEESYGYAIEGGAYAAFAVRYLVAVLLLSVVGTAFVNLGAVGIVVGAALAAPVGLIFNVAVMEFVRDLETDSEATTSNSVA